MKTGGISRVVGGGLALAFTCALLLGVVYLAAALLAGSWAGEAATEVAPGIPDWAEGFTTASPAGDSDMRDDRMLAAQERMAAIAVWMFVIGVITSVITAVGTFFLIQQIRITRQALEHAETANTLALDGQKRQLRAYVSAKILVEDGRHKIRFINSGATPALEFSAWVTSHIYARGGSEPIDFDEDGYILPLAPNDVCDVVMNYSDTGNRALQDSGTETIIAIDAGYEDIFHEVHKFVAVFEGYSDGEFVLESGSSSFT
ncbi:hypothetical protein AAW00_13520 [Aurantiacibacter luteus]|uniref:Uncharacterized protein n=2 Tax=Aurantiacibacter luteus TaxID=1581420 RepID=A0A0G9MP12_9SPHN|nr:hypothetical protein AAW00_13520 [Aurantiacibacter luteus]